MLSTVMSGSHDFYGCPWRILANSRELEVVEREEDNRFVAVKSWVDEAYFIRGDDPTSAAYPGLYPKAEAEDIALKLSKGDDYHISRAMFINVAEWLARNRIH